MNVAAHPATASTTAGGEFTIGLPMCPEEVMLQTLSANLVRAGYAQDQADRFAVLIGDTPQIDGAGQVVVSEHGQELARVPGWVIE